MASVNVENIERKLQGVSNTQDSIQSLSLWAIHHKTDAKHIVEMWLKVVKKAKTKQKLALFNLCNDIVQNGKRKKASIYIEVYKDVLRDAIVLVKEESIAKNVTRILKIWRERHIFPKDFLAEITELYESKESSTHSTPTPVANHSSSSTPTVTATQQPVAVPKPVATYPVNIDPQLIAEFKPQSLIDKINNYKRFEAEVELKRKQLSNMKLDASSTEAIKQLKDKAHGNQFSKQFEESCNKLEDYVSSANKDLLEKAALIEMLETSQLFYEEQYKEAKIVANAYKNFGTRINNLRKRLEDLVKSLPSPVPSPSRDAPSPGNTPPEDTLDNIESVDMDLDDEASNSIIPKTITETASVVLEDADESYDPAADPYLPTQPQFTQPFTADTDTLQNISSMMTSQHSVAPSQGSTYNGHDPRKSTNGVEIPVYNPPPKASAIKVLSKQSKEEGEGTPVKDEGSSTPVMDEKQDSPPPAKQHQNPIDFLTQILANTAKTTASGSNFLASLSLLTNTVKTQFQHKKEDTTTMNNQPIMSEQSAGSWAEWKAQNTTQQPPPGAIPPILPPPMFPQMVQPPMSQPPPLSRSQPPMVNSQIPISSQSHVPSSPPILSTANPRPQLQHPYGPVSTPYGNPVNSNPGGPPEPWRPPTLAPLQRPPFPSFAGQPPVRMGAGDHMLSPPPWRPPPPNSQGPVRPPLQPHDGHEVWGEFQHQRHNTNLQSPPPQMVSPPVQPKSILRNRASSLREISLVENDNMAINPEPPSEPPSPIEGRNKFMKPGSDSGGQVADDHREFLEKLKRKTAGGPNLVSPPVIDEVQNNNKPKMFATNRSRPNLTTITPVDFDEPDHNHLNENENGAEEEVNNDSLNAISGYTDQEEEYDPEEGMEEVIEEAYDGEANEYEQQPEEAEQYEEVPYHPPPQDFRPPFHRHPRPPPPHHEPFFHPRFPPRFERPYGREPNFPDFRDPYGGPPPKRPYHDNYRPFRRPFNRY
ncbi:uncharacterized protein LOC143071345 [Mytilus galloprovincialis]|uniref:uncharacterized protein LOC143071345 n=1 Tax=Mytilus galloprovincialis TaxID=29158 RepID=UPI003F7C4CE7